MLKVFELCVCWGCDMRALQWHISLYIWWAPCQYADCHNDFHRDSIREGWPSVTLGKLSCSKSNYYTQGGAFINQHNSASLSTVCDQGGHNKLLLLSFREGLKKILKKIWNFPHWQRGGVKTVHIYTHF